MSKRTAVLYFQDILTSLENIAEYTKGLDLESFKSDKKTVDAVVRNLEIIGEAAKNIPKRLRNQYSKIPWEKMVGMRNKVIHEYFGVDVEILWQTLQEDLPELKKQIKGLVL